MAQTNYTPISLYYSTTASAVPTAANLVPGELAINTADGKLYYEDSAGVVQVLATKSTGSIGGSNTQVQFNNSGSLGGSSGLTWDGSFLTTNSIKNSALTSGRVTYAGASGLLKDSANMTFDDTSLTLGGQILLSNNNYIGFKNTSASVAASIFNDTSNFLNLYNSSNTGTIFYVNAGERLRLTNTTLYTASGVNVGIGTSSPDTKLQILDIAGGTTGTIKLGSSVYYGTIQHEAGVTGALLYDVAAASGGGHQFRLGGTTLMNLNGSGNLGLGVTPSAWAATNPIKAIQVGRGGSISYSNDSASTNIVAGAYLSATNQWTKIGTVAAAKLALSDYDGSFLWSRAASGSGNFTYTDVMTLDASGNLLVGTTSIDSGFRLNVVGGGIYSLKGSSGTAFQTSNLTSADFSIATTSGGITNIGTTGNVLAFTTGSERMRITSGGFTKASNTGTYVNSTGTYHELQANNTNDYVVVVSNSNSTPAYEYIQDWRYTASTPNNGNARFWNCTDATADRAYMLSNGGLANYAANNVILSDSREKTNFAPSKSYLDVICAIPVQTFNYIDQNLIEDDGLTLGVTAQDVQAVAPELVSEGNWGTKDEPKMRLQIYQTDLQYALMKCIQEQQALIESLTTRLNALENK